MVFLETLLCCFHFIYLIFFTFLWILTFLAYYFGFFGFFLIGSVFTTHFYNKIEEKWRIFFILQRSTIFTQIRMCIYIYVYIYIYIIYIYVLCIIYTHILCIIYIICVCVCVCVYNVMTEKGNSRNEIWHWPNDVSSEWELKSWPDSSVS